MTQQSIRDRILSRAEPELAAAPMRTVRGWARGILWGGLGVVGVLLIGGLAAMQFPAVQNVFAQSGEAPATPAAAPGMSLPQTPFLDHVQQAGLASCGNVYPVLGMLLTAGSDYSVQSEWNSGEPNGHPVQALVGMNYASEGYSGPAAGIVFAAPVGGACEGTMVRIVPFSGDCGAVAGRLPQGSTLASNLGPVPVYDLADNGGQVLLVPGPGTCVALSVARAAG